MRPRFLPGLASAAERGRRAAGFTLVELMAVVLILGLLMSMAAPSFSDFMANQRAKMAASDLHTSLLRARSEAIKRNASVIVSPKAGAWINGWLVESVATAEAPTQVIEDHGPVASASVSTEAASVTYRSSGRLSGVGAVMFDVTPDRTGGQPRCVEVDISGRPLVRTSQCVAPAPEGG